AFSVVTASKIYTARPETRRVSPQNELISLHGWEADAQSIPHSKSDGNRSRASWQLRRAAGRSDWCQSAAREMTFFCKGVFTSAHTYFVPSLTKRRG
ncbi:unnamed protein product, partial [Ectocarpus sp. 12 AP-2014]